MIHPGVILMIKILIILKKTLQGIENLMGQKKNFWKNMKVMNIKNSLKKLWNMNMKVIIIKKKKKVLN